MCGISACVSRQQSSDLDQHFRDQLHKRGPDHLGHFSTQFEVEGFGKAFVSCTSTVLALRGDRITPQPFVDELRGSLFCWNGEAWKLKGFEISENDGQIIFNALIEASCQSDALSARNATLDVLRSISGPFAFFFFDNLHREIYYGRDRLGRRSLLYKYQGGNLELASIAHTSTPEWCEVEADGIYHHDLNAWFPLQTPNCDKVSDSFPLSAQYSWDDDALLSSLGQFNKTLPMNNTLLDLHSQSVKLLREQLTESLRLRTLNVPLPPGVDQEHDVRIAILFSGGLDCTVLARMAHDVLPHNQHIDLINVAFENPRVVQAAKNAAKLQKFSDTRPREDRNSDCNGAVDGELPSSPYERCPDRETGRKAHQELETVCPNRVWRFVAINVPYTETLAHRDTVVGLIHPHNTEMDLSIANALYFASRGIGVITNSDTGSTQQYATPARILMSGLGADELFGGYTRHSTAFNRHGYQGLIDELELDVNRLGKRNLGRDDRVISHWGKEARFPFLDESLVKWAVESPIWEKCGFGADDHKEPDSLNIEPEKKVLRLLAYSLGMHSVAHEKKRAIQFGARTAKMEVGRTKGTQTIS